MDDCTCGVGVRWCARADALFDVPGMHVLDVAVDGRDRLVLTVETDQADGPTGQVETFVEGPGRSGYQLLTKRDRYGDAVSQVSPRRRAMVTTSVIMRPRVRRQ